MWSFIEADLLSSVVGREEHCRQILLACVWGARRVWTTLGLPPLTEACAFRVYTAQVPGHYPSRPCLSCTSQGQATQVLGKSTRAQTRLGIRFVLFRSWAGQATRYLASALSQVGCASYHLSGPSRSVSLLCRMSTISAVHLIWGVISGCDLLAGVSHAGSQVDVVRSWGPAHGLVEGGCRLWGRDWSSPLPSGYGSRMPVSLPWRGSGRGGEVVYAAGSLLWYSQSFVVWAGQAVC